MSVGTTSPGQRPHRIFLQNPWPVVLDGDGGYTQTYFDLAPPAMYAEILPASAPVALQRVRQNSVTATDTHIVTMPYHPQVIIKTRILFNGRIFNVTSAQNVEERNVTTIAVCVELVL